MVTSPTKVVAAEAETEPATVPVLTIDPEPAGVEGLMVPCPGNVVGGLVEIHVILKAVAGGSPVT